MAEEQIGPSVYRCTEIGWDDEPFGYHLIMRFADIVSASVEAPGLALLMRHCAPAGVWRPNDLVGKLFEIWWQHAGKHLGGGGDMIYAIRIHPSYRDYKDRNRQWLKVGIRLSDSADERRIAGWMSVEDDVSFLEEPAT